MPRDVTHHTSGRHAGARIGVPDNVLVKDERGGVVTNSSLEVPSMASILSMVADGRLPEAERALAVALASCDDTRLGSLHSLGSLIRWYLAAEQGALGGERLNQAIHGYETMLQDGLGERHLSVEIALACALGNAGDFEAGLEWLEKVAVEAARRRDGRSEVLALTNKASLWCRAGDFDGALQLNRQALSLCREALADLRILVLNNQSYALLLQARQGLGAPDDRAGLAVQALAHAEEALALLPIAARSPAHWRGVLLGNQGAALALLGRFEQADQAFLQALAVKDNPPPAQAELLTQRAEMLLEGQRPDEARVMLDRAASLLGTDSQAELVERVMDLRIRLARLQGRHDLAHELWEQRLQQSEARHRERLRHVRRNVRLMSRLRQARDEQQAALFQAEALRQAKAQFEGMISALPDLLFLIDRKGVVLRSHSINEDGYYVPPSRFLGKPFSEFLPESASITLTRAVERARLHGVDRGAVYSLPMPDGTRWFEVSIAAIRGAPSPELEHFVLLARDITSRVEVESELRNAKLEAELANRAKTAFLANTSHEIRTPLNAIIGYADILGASPTLSAEHLQFVDEIRHAGRHLLGLVNDVLDLSRIESDRFELQRCDFDLREVIHSLRSIVGPAARDKGLGLELSFGGIPPLLHGDPGRLRQALLNYLNNAIKFTASGAIRLDGELLGQHGESLTVRFTVCDTGIGIAPAQLERLFQRFEQADVSSTRSFEGAGLGLAITRRLAQLMQGEAGGTSTPGKGSCFWFTATLERAREATSVPADLYVPSTRDPRRALEAFRERHPGLRVLLVEDNAVSRALAVRMLKQAGAIVQTASDGLQAVDLCRRGGHDLVLMDVQMPGTDGLQATRAIRQFADCGRLPIVAITGNAFDWQRQECLQAGMDGFVTKPIDWARLWDVLDGLLSTRRVTQAGETSDLRAWGRPPP